MIQAALIKYGIIAGVFVTILFGMYLWGDRYGRKQIQALWDADKVVVAEATSKAVANRLLENEKLRLKNLEDMKKVTENYETKLRNRTSALSSGLFLSKAACGDTPTVPGTSPPTPSVDGATAVIRLPDSVEQRLRAIADEANICVIRLKELQDWESKQ